MAVPNGLNPSFESIGLNAGPNFFSGAMTADGSISAEVGAVTPGSIYISTNGSGEIWVLLQADAANVWTKLTIN